MNPVYLYVVPFFPSSSSWRGGFFYDAVKALMRDGRYDVLVMSTGVSHDYEIDGITVYGVGTYKLGDSDYFSTITDVIKLRLFAKKLRQMGISPRDVSVCHVHLLERMAIYSHWIKKKNPKCLTFIHHHWTGMAKPTKSKLWQLFPFENDWAYWRLQRSFVSADAHIFCSQMTKDGFGKVYLNSLLDEPKDIRTYLKLGRYLKPLTYKASKIVYNGIDAQQFYPDATQRDCNIFKIGCVANFIETKGQHILIEAFAKVAKQMPNARLYFVGTGARLHDCQHLAAELGIEHKVEFLAEVSHSEIAHFYQSLNLYVLPSYHEAFNCSLIEAYGCGVPAIAADIISFREVLNTEMQSQWLAPARDSDALATKLLWVYSKGTSLHQELTQSLDINQVTEAFLSWIERLN